MTESPEILLVEDNSSDAELAMMTISEEGYFNRTKIINNGEEALNFLMPTSMEDQKKNTQNLKLILLDLMLPKYNGFEVLGKLDKNKFTTDIAVVIFSSSEIENDVKQAYELGANGYLVKPIDFIRHQHILRSALNFWVNDDKKQRNI